MARIYHDNAWYEQVAPWAFYELAIEELILLNAHLLYPAYYVFQFKQRLITPQGNAVPDLVFISKNYDEWFIVEVEMAHHSFDNHVRPQIEVFANAAYGRKQAEYLASAHPELDLQELEKLFSLSPPRILVIVNENRPDWSAALANYDGIVTTFELFRAEDETEIFLIDGEYPSRILALITKCSTHPSASNLLVIHAGDVLGIPPQGRVKLRFGNYVTLWKRIDSGSQVLLRPDGPNPLEKPGDYEIGRQRDGQLVLSYVS